MSEAEVTWVTHGRARLALHHLADGPGRPLLLLHGLGERSPVSAPEPVAGWPGPVHALDFTGHGRSTVPAGGGYTAEVLMADADAAVGHLGSATVLGRGLGAYVALLLAGARPADVRGAILTDGPGLVGGGVHPGSLHVPTVEVRPIAPDPHALAELSRDVRPADYAHEYLRQAVEWSGLEVAVAVCTVVRPEWLAAVAGEPGTIDCPLADALAQFAAI